VLNKKGENTSCITENRGRPRVHAHASRIIGFRLRPGTWHDEILEWLDDLPEGTKSVWMINTLLAEIRGEARNPRQRAGDSTSEIDGETLDLLLAMTEDEDM